MINLVIPMAGKGSRFASAGFHIPKYLIEVKGKTLFEHSLSGLPMEQIDRLIFITLESHCNEYQLKPLIESQGFNKEYQILTVPGVTGGQAETVLTAKHLIDNDDDLIIFNIDTLYRSANQSLLLRDPNKKLDGVIGSARLPGDHWSFAKTNKEGIVTETSEKVRISPNALTGFYHFSMGSDFVRVAENRVSNNTRNNNEFYIAPMYNDLIAEGKKYVLDAVDLFIPLGTPEEVAKNGEKIP